MLKKLLVTFWRGNQNLLRKLFGLPLKPRWMWFAVTDRCNSHCTHCHIWQQTPIDNPLSLEEARKIFSDPLLKNIELVINSGGEAILHPRILELLKLEHEMFPRAILNISTNAILADRVINTTKELLRDGVKLNLGVSLDGFGEKHDQVRGVPGNFEKVDYLLKQLLEIQKSYPETLTITAGFTLSELTIDNWLEVKEYTDKLGVELMVQWYNQSSFYGNEKDENKAVKERITEIVSAQPNSTTRERWLRLLADKSIKFRCFATDTFFAMKSDGSIIPCLTHWDMVLGNPRDSSMTKVWNSQKAKEIRKKVAACPGCLNSWGLNWSLSSAFYPRLMFFVRNPKEIIKRLKEGK